MNNSEMKASEPSNLQEVAVSKPNLSIDTQTEVEPANSEELVKLAIAEFIELGNLKNQRISERDLPNAEIFLSQFHHLALKIDMASYNVTSYNDEAFNQSEWQVIRAEVSELCAKLNEAQSTHASEASALNCNDPELGAGSREQDLKPSASKFNFADTNPAIINQVELMQLVGNTNTSLQTFIEIINQKLTFINQDYAKRSQLELLGTEVEQLKNELRSNIFHGNLFPQSQCHSQNSNLISPISHQSISSDLNSDCVLPINLRP